jgi:hypothetical protein
MPSDSDSSRFQSLLIGGIFIGNLTLVGVTMAEPLKTNIAIGALAEIGVIILLFEVGLESDLGEMLEDWGIPSGALNHQRHAALNFGSERPVAPRRRATLEEGAPGAIIAGVESNYSSGVPAAPWYRRTRP